MSDTEFLILGANGQLGKALAQKYPGAKSTDMDVLDITSMASLNSFDWSGIKYILNAAAYTNVDGAETNEGRVAAWKVNAEAVSNLVNVALKNDITLVHVSTDYVFDGTSDNHLETEAFSPLSVYGQTKAAADIVVRLLPKHYILRTSWVIGDGNNFVRTMLGLGKKGIAPKVVDDQIGRLTFTDELVKAIDFLLNHNSASGTYNVTNGGEPASWADITIEIFKLANFNLDVGKVTTEEYYEGKDNIAPRPLKSALSLDKITGLGFELTDWKEALSDYVKKELNE
ncbi:MAG TPA: NAD(P)-dependent oxidoreductase [Candidatus Sulfotelmatobacter sp.]|nr:NAD(P)-dependent oxidoreductase [Candidatus Sulfotelmatobacter sp.]